MKKRVLWCVLMCLMLLPPVNGTPGRAARADAGDKWAARIQYKGKIYSLGCYERLEDAVRARKKAENWVKDDAERLLALLNAPEQAG